MQAKRAWEIKQLGYDPLNVPGGDDEEESGWGDEAGATAPKLYEQEKERRTNYSPLINMRNDPIPVKKEGRPKTIAQLKKELLAKEKPLDPPFFEGPKYVKSKNEELYEI